MQGIVIGWKEETLKYMCGCFVCGCELRPLQTNMIWCVSIIVVESIHEK